MNPAIALAHFEIAGGTRAVVRWAGGVAALGAVGLTLYARAGGGGVAGAVNGSLGVALVGVGVMLVVLANVRIGAALKLDGQLDMARSHRLMAVDAPAAVLGYALGPALPALAAAGVFALYAAVGFVADGSDLAAAVGAIGLIATTAAMIAMLNVLGGLSSIVAGGGGKPGGGIGWLWGVSAGAFFGTGGAIFALVPWAATLTAVFAGNTVFALRGAGTLDAAHAVGAAMTGSLALLFFLAACRRWRRPDRPAMGAGLWLALIGLVVLGTLAAVYWYADMVPAPGRGSRPSPGLTIPGTLLLLALLALGPLFSAERQAAAYRLRRNLDDPDAAEDRPRLASWLAAALVGVVALPLLLLQPAPDVASPREFTLLVAGHGVRVDSAAEWAEARRLARSAWPVAAAGFAAFLVTAWAVARGLTRLRRAPLTFWALVILWALPLVAGIGLTYAQAIAGGAEVESPVDLVNPVSAASLPGALFYAWNGGGSAAWPGVAAQWAVAVVLAVIALRVPDRVARPATRELPVTTMPPAA